MSDTTWTLRREPAGQGERYRVDAEAGPLSFRRVFELLESSDAFALWYTERLASASSGAFFWEHPPLTLSSLDDPYEVVVLPAAALERARPDAAAFAEHFERGGEIVVFDNLGGDATLVVPAPRAQPQCYTHLAAFVRAAPAAQVRALWRAVASATIAAIGDRPRWLSTAGLGVFWLHVRLDSRPKYYRHDPYRR